MSHPVSYVLDANDRVVGVGGSWDAFAEENNGRAVVAERVMGVSIWDQISDQSLRVILRMVLKRVRSGGALRFHFQCDSPDRKRTHEMQVVPADNGCVELSSREVPHRNAPMLAVRPSDDDTEMITVCSWCDRVLLPTSDWVSVDVALDHMGYLERPAPPQVTHGICAGCRATAFDRWLLEDSERA